MVHFYGLVSCSDPGLRISLSPGLLHHCSKAMNSDLLKMRLHSLDMFNCMRPSQKLHNKDKKYFCLNIYKELFAFMVVKTKKCRISRILHLFTPLWIHFLHDSNSPASSGLNCGVSPVKKV